ncbi:MAG: hypothetical protein IJX13_04810 [Clostridia bacterium]|nr:hypothetical protein [Clostridia bacterium]
MNYQSKITGFGEYTIEQLTRLQSDLSLNVSVKTLSFCSQYYKTEERDPSVDELRMLDALSTSLEKDLDAIAPTELLTNDAFVAETYADLIKKRKVLNPNATHPCTLKEATRIASAYLFRSGKATPSRCASLIPEHLSLSRSLFGDAVFTAPDSPFRLRILPYATSGGKVGDVFLLATPELGQTQLQFEKRMEDLLQSEHIRPYLKGVYTVSESGVLHTLLTCVNGLSISLSPFSKLNVPMPLTVLTDQFSSSKLLRVSPDRLSALLRRLSDEGIHAFAFAEVTNDAKYTFYRGKEDIFSLHTQFLRMLFHYKAATAKLADEHFLSPAGIDHRILSEASCKYLNVGFPDSDTVKIHDVLSAAASATCKQAYYKTALYATLAPVLSLCACGVDHNDQQLSISIDLPEATTAPQAVGAALSTILGIYRAQTELGIPAQAISTHTTREQATPTVTAFATASGDPRPGEFLQEKNFVYCLTPRLRENGLPDFTSLREMMDTLVRLSKSGAILSARVLCFESITDGIQKMSKGYTCRLTNLTVASCGKLPLGVLIESDRALPFQKVGITVPKKAPVSLPMTVSLPEKDSFIWSECPEVVMIAKQTDADAHILARYLEKNGCCVHLFSSGTTEDARLSRALMGAQTLILCANATMPKTERFNFALSTFRSAGGLSISVGVQKKAQNEFLPFKNGICESVLKKICRK